MKFALAGVQVPIVSFEKGGYAAQFKKSTPSTNSNYTAKGEILVLENKQKNNLNFPPAFRRNSVNILP